MRKKNIQMDRQLISEVEYYTVDDDAVQRKYLKRKRAVQQPDTHKYIYALEQRIFALERAMNTIQSVSKQQYIETLHKIRKLERGT